MTEPIVSLVACALLRNGSSSSGSDTTEDGVSWAEAIRALRQVNQMSSAPLHVGSCGELVAQITLVIAYYTASRADTAAIADVDPETSQLVGQTFVSVKSFLTALVGHGPMTTLTGLALSTAFSGAHVRFMTFMEIPRHGTDVACITKDATFQAWHWGVAWVGHPSQPVWDLMITVYTVSLKKSF